MLVVVLALKVFVPQLDDLKQSLEALKEANKEWFLLGTIVYWCGLPILAKQFMVIAKVPLQFWLTLKVQIAGLFVSKLLPSSLGTLSLNTYYLTQRKHTVQQAASVMAMNGLTSGVAYFVLILLALIASSAEGSSQLEGKHVVLLVCAAAALLVLIIVVLFRIGRVRRLFHRLLGSIYDNIEDYKNNKRGVLWAIFLNGIGSLTSNFALFASARALGMDISLPQAFLAYTFGNVAAGLVPTPGGLGAAEAGLYAAFTLMGFGAAESMAAVGVYRLISFWIPAVPGYIAFASLRKDVLAAFSIKPKKKTSLAT